MPKISRAPWIAGTFGFAALCLGDDLWAQAQPTQAPDRGTVTPAASGPKYPELPSETPQKFVRPTYGADYDSRDVMIPMRDGVKLHTIILLPKGTGQAGILLTRTPYEAKHMAARSPSLHLGSRL